MAGMTRIVTYALRPKRPPRKRKAVEPVPAKDARPPAIVTTRKPSKSGKPPRTVLPDMTPEEHQRRGDAGEALCRELARGSTAEE